MSSPARCPAEGRHPRLLPPNERIQSCEICTSHSGTSAPNGHREAQYSSPYGRNADACRRRKDVSDFLEAQARRPEIVEPGLLGEIIWGRITFVLTSASIDQYGMLRRAHKESLVGNNYPAADGIEHNGIEFGEVASPDLRIIGREHIFWLAPRTVALNKAGDGHVADLERFHGNLPPVFLGRPSLGCRVQSTYHASVR